MIYLALGLVAAWAWFSLGGGGRRPGARLAAGVRGTLGVWRPTAGLAAVALLLVALVLAVREDWLAAAGLGAVGLGLALSARRRRRVAPAQAASTPTMNPQQARAILGVGPAATAAEVQSAYRRLMRSVHPDQGGTAGLAAQLNAARETLRRPPP